MAKSKGYQGHKSRAAWNVALWIGNDEGLYRPALACMRRARTKDKAARELLECLPEKTPDGYPYTLSSVRAALVGLS